MMKIAVTGSKGFIGKMLVEELRALGHEVTGCNHEDCDILNIEQVKKRLAGSSIAIHCAAQLGEEAGNLWEVNVKGTENVLEACAANRVEHLVFLSTAGVYGSARGVCSEETVPEPETLYEKSKLEAEKKVLSYQELFHVTILRPALVLGNNDYWRQIISTIKKGFPLIGSGKNKWQLACAEDLVSAIIFCIGREECYGETFIVAEKEAMELWEIADIIRKEPGMKTPIPKIPVWLGKINAQMNSVLNFNPLLKPPYLKRMLREREYSTRKLEALGWRAKGSTRAELPRIVKEIAGQTNLTTEKQ